MYDYHEWRMFVVGSVLACPSEPPEFCKRQKHQMENGNNILDFTHITYTIHMYNLQRVLTSLTEGGAPKSQAGNSFLPGEATEQ